MRYVALATDYDGTLAHDGIVSPETLEALGKLRQSGRKLIMVTGRELPDLQRVFSRLDLFERVVAENGALLYNPASKEKRLLVEAPPEKFVEALRRRGVTNISTGGVIVAMWRPHEKEAIDAIRDLGLELQVIFNKDAVMVLPSGINKMTGLAAALKELSISRHGVVGIGDAENDHAFLGSCECSAAVSNAIPSLKEEVDLVTRRSHGDGVSELVGMLLDNDLSDLGPRLTRHNIPLGSNDLGEIGLNPYGTAALVCGQSGGGKTTLISGFVERLTAKDYQTCLIDPEGDYEHAEQFLSTGDAKHAPSLEHLESNLGDPGSQVAVNLVGVPLDHRAELLQRVLSLIQEYRVRTGRPHWLIVDEAHHMLPSEWAGPDLSGHRGGLVLVTVHPEHVSPAVLKHLNVVITVGEGAQSIIAEFCKVVGRPVPKLPEGELDTGEAFVWFLDSPEIVRIRTLAPRVASERHKRKYAEGQLEEERVFYFRGPEDKLRLRAHNLIMFIQLAEGLDEDTWSFHLKRGDYSRWLREGVKDPDLAEILEGIEQDDSLSAVQSRSLIIQAIQEKYTAPA